MYDYIKDLGLIRHAYAATFHRGILRE